MLLEICANSLTSAVNAEKAGANRVELCENLLIGGTTPSFGTINLCRKMLSIPICVLIRPRGGDFCYSALEFETMQEDIFFSRKSGINAVVIGILNPDGTIDEERMKELMKIARPMDVVFHRAFDVVPDQFDALETLITLGCKRILTSGGAENVFKGRRRLAELIKKAKGRIEILPGGGINERNIAAIIKSTKTEQIHLTAKTLSESQMLFRPTNVKFNAPKMTDEYALEYSDVERIKGLIKILQHGV